MCTFWIHLGHISVLVPIDPRSKEDALSSRSAAMGSVGIFDRLQCVLCESESMINTEWAPCLDCQNNEFVERTTSSIAFRHLRNASHLSETPLHLVSTFIHWNDSDAEFKRQYLLSVLMTKGSVFRQFTFFYNKKSGNISDREDVIDRIISFVA